MSINSNQYPCSTCGVVFHSEDARTRHAFRCLRDNLMKEELRREKKNEL